MHELEGSTSLLEQGSNSQGHPERTQHICRGLRSAEPAAFRPVTSGAKPKHQRLSEERLHDLAEILKARRQSANLTQEHVATMAGINTEHLQRLERGVGNPTLATMYALADALAVPIVSLLPD